MVIDDRPTVEISPTVEIDDLWADYYKKYEKNEKAVVPGFRPVFILKRDDRMEPITILPLVYVLELEEGNYYIGATMNFNQRLAQHMSGVGAGWTKLHKPIRVSEILINYSKTLENETTLKYIEIYGEDKVRGGVWCSAGGKKVIIKSK